MRTSVYGHCCRLSKAAPAAMLFALVALFPLTPLCRAEDLRTQPAGNDHLGYPTNSVTALELGRFEASRDLSNGVMIVKSAGLPSPEWADYEQLLQTRYNVKFKPIAGCLVSEGLMAYLRGYDEISGAAIKRKYGTNIFERLAVEAEAIYHKRLAAEAKLESRKSLAGPGTYTVKAGDTLTTIARTRGIKVDALLQANPGINPARLQVNQKVVIPERKQP